MVDKKKNSDDEFDFDDEFPTFDDSEEYHFDEEEVSSDAFDFSDGSTDDVEEDTLTDDVLDEETKPAQAVEEAYQFESTDDEIITPSSDGNFIEQLIERIKKEEPKKLIMYAGVGFFGLILVIFLVLRVSSSSTEPPKEAFQQKEAAKLAENKMPTLNPSSLPTLPPSAVPANQGAALSAPVSPPVSNTAQSVASADNDMEKMLNMLVQQNQQLSAQVQALQGQLQAAVNGYNQLNQQLQADDARVTNIEQSMNAMQAQMAKVSNAIQTIVTAATQEDDDSGVSNGQMVSNTVNNGPRVYVPRKSAANRQDATYYIQAIIPGRAWLKDSEGQTITVTYGDRIPGFGKVTKIDAENGIVLTSSGNKILYGIGEG